MNVNKKAHSLYQSMDRWILLYRRIHECDHNTAHDAFDAWADKLRGESADQSTTQFHEAVDASFEEMKAKHPKTVQVEAMVMTSQGKIDRLTVTPIEPLPNLTGGPLLELSYGKQPPRRPFGKAEYGGPSDVIVPDNAPIGGPILDTGKDPLGFQEEQRSLESQGYGNARPKMTTEETREHVKKIIAEQERKLTTMTDQSEIQLVKANIESAKRRLGMLDEVEAREKERKGTLSLPRK